MDHSELCLIVFLLDQHDYSSDYQHQTNNIHRSDVIRSTRHYYPRSDPRHHRGLPSLHQLHPADHGKEHHEASDDHDSPLSKGRHHHLRSSEEDRQKHPAEEDELMSDRIRVRSLQPRYFSINQPEQNTRNELENLTCRIIILEDDRSHNDTQKEELVVAHSTALQRLPDHGEEDTSRSVPANKDTQNDGSVQHHAHNLEPFVVGRSGQVRHELVLSNDGQVVEEEGEEEGEVDVLKQWNCIVVCGMDLHNDQERNQDDEGQS